MLIFVVVSSFWHKRLEHVKQTQNDESIRVAETTSPEVENLKRALAERDQKITALETAIRQNASKDAGPKTASPSVAPDQKDKIIASLQLQLKEKEAALQTANSTPPVTNVNTGDNSEWKQKYASLKASYDKVSANEKTLKNAYKTVADDNKRLLTQLQSIKKE